ncbi:MAG: OprD family porin [Pseudomonas sp.]
MQVMKWSVIALAVAAGTTQMAVANQQAESKGFVEDSSLTLLNRNFYFNRDFKHGAAGNTTSDGDRKGYREEWAHGVMAEYASGFTQGTVGFGVDAYGYLGLKLDTGKGRTGLGLLPRDSDGDIPDDYSEAGGAVKMRVSSTVLSYGNMRTAAPVFATSDSRLLPETATGFHLTSEEIENLSLEAGHFTAYNLRNSTNHDDELLLNYGGNEIGKTIDFAGGYFKGVENLTLGLYASEFEDTWRQYYGNVNYNIPLAEAQALNLDFNIYRTSDTGDELQGDISNTIWSLAGAYSLGAHTFTLAYQRVHGDTPFDYVGGDSIFVANSVQISDFNAPGEKSWQARYDLNMAEYGVPGLSFMARYIKGSDADGSDADAAGGYAYYNGVTDGDEHETNVEVKYVLQEGPAKDLSFRLRQAYYRADSDLNNVVSDLNDTRLIIQYPLNIL